MSSIFDVSFTLFLGVRRRFIQSIEGKTDFSSIEVLIPTPNNENFTQNHLYRDKTSGRNQQKSPLSQIHRVQFKSFVVRLKNEINLSGFFIIRQYKNFSTICCFAWINSSLFQSYRSNTKCWNATHRLKNAFKMIELDNFEIFLWSNKKWVVYRGHTKMDLSNYEKSFQK